MGMATQLHSFLTEDNLQIIGHGVMTQRINSMDKDTLMKPTKHADSLPPHRSKLAHSSKTWTKDKSQEANTSPGYKVSAQMAYGTKASFHASKQGPDDGLTPVFKHKVTPVKTGTETSDTKISDHFSDGADTSEPKQSAKKTKVVKKGIAQIVKKKQKKGGWKYVDEY
ncbi:MAG: hypothetical protein OHK93_007892 [Ramalina farinacea]|uniref:Uncharacterized protein n=1 Tax=Ramalina farinacea TaxID=258253 RepID=A0AA43QMJ7_9LECA|nr:hypothetical protein [Ramalina farinacea]